MNVVVLFVLLLAVVSFCHSSSPSIYYLAGYNGSGCVGGAPLYQYAVPTPSGECASQSCHDFPFGPVSGTAQCLDSLPEPVKTNQFWQLSYQGGDCSGPLVAVMTSTSACVWIGGQYNTITLQGQSTAMAQAFRDSACTVPAAEGHKIPLNQCFKVNGDKPGVYWGAIATFGAEHNATKKVW